MEVLPTGGSDHRCVLTPGNALATAPVPHAVSVAWGVCGRYFVIVAVVRSTALNGGTDVRPPVQCDAVRWNGYLFWGGAQRSAVVGFRF